MCKYVDWYFIINYIKIVVLKLVFIWKKWDKVYLDMFLYLLDNCIIFFVIKCFKIWESNFIICVFFSDDNVIDVWVNKKIVC